jgi:hypothetical protein
MCVRTGNDLQRDASTHILKDISSPTPVVLRRTRYWSPCAPVRVRRTSMSNRTAESAAPVHALLAKAGGATKGRGRGYGAAHARKRSSTRVLGWRPALALAVCTFLSGHSHSWLGGRVDKPPRRCNARIDARIGGPRRRHTPSAQTSRRLRPSRTRPGGSASPPSDRKQLIGSGGRA